MNKIPTGARYDLAYFKFQLGKHYKRQTRDGVVRAVLQIREVRQRAAGDEIQRDRAHEHRAGAET